MNIRQGVFETNSSSTHSISILSQEDFDNWRDNDLYFDESSKKVLTRDEVKEFLQAKNAQINVDNKKELDEAAKEYVKFSYEQYFFNDDDTLESFFEKFVTKGGEEVIAFGQFG